MVVVTVMMVVRPGSCGIRCRKGENINAITICLQNIEEISKDAEKFLRILGNAQSKGSFALLKRWIEHLRFSSRKICSVIEDPYINKLIEMAKHADAVDVEGGWETRVLGHQWGRGSHWQRGGRERRWAS